jgi:hypothetical protein
MDKKFIIGLLMIIGLVLLVGCTPLDPTGKYNVETATYYSDSAGLQCMEYKDVPKGTPLVSEDELDGRS